MRAVIEKEIQKIDEEIVDMEGRLKRAVAEFRECAETYSPYEIVTFIRGKLSDVEYEYNRLSELSERRRMLNYLLHQ